VKRLPATVPATKAATGAVLCPVCRRKVDKLYPVKVFAGETKARIEQACYACKFNVFPPDHECFVRVQEWRSEHGLSVRTLTDDQRARATIVRQEREVRRAEKKAAQRPPDWVPMQDKERIATMLHMVETGQMVNVVNSPCYICRTPIPAPVAVDLPPAVTGEGKKHKVQWNVCSQACADQWGANLADAVRRGAIKPFRAPRYSAEGRLQGYVYPGQGFKALGEAEQEPVFCAKCDRLVEVCDCPGGPT